MPKWLHDKLARQARKEHITGKRRKAYIYGTLQEHEKRKKSLVRRRKDVVRREKRS